MLYTSFYTSVNTTLLSYPYQYLVIRLHFL
nr:MAG TPA: hypothetical protein [Caudoviricetes sp.]